MNDQTCTWEKPPEWSRVRAGMVDVWVVGIRRGVHDCWLTLTPDEVDRARRIRTSLARDEFVTGRGALRQLLGWEFDCDPRTIELAADVHGKPVVCGSRRGAAIEFNLAHSGGVVLIALSRAGVVGIDIEEQNRSIEALDVARGSFHADEIAWLEGLSADALAKEFFRCWTRKESVSKADGRGLLLPLNGFSVATESEAAGESVVTVNAERESGSRGGARYYVRDLPVGEGLLAALALGAPGARVTIHRLRPAETPDGGETGWANPSGGRRTEGNHFRLLPGQNAERNVGLSEPLDGPSV